IRRPLCHALAPFRRSDGYRAGSTIWENHDRGTNRRGTNKAIDCGISQRRGCAGRCVFSRPCNRWLFDGWCLMVCYGWTLALAKQALYRANDAGVHVGLERCGGLVDSLGLRLRHTYTGRAVSVREVNPRRVPAYLRAATAMEPRRTVDT